MPEHDPQPAPGTEPPPRAPWVAPVVHDLPRLTSLTLQTGFIPGEEGVF